MSQQINDQVSFSFLVFISILQVKNGTLTKCTLGTTNLKFEMYPQLDSESNMGRVSPGHTSPSIRVELKKFVCVCACLCVSSLSPKHHTK